MNGFVVKDNRNGGTLALRTRTRTRAGSRGGHDDKRSGDKRRKARHEGFRKERAWQRGARGFRGIASPEPDWTVDFTVHTVKEIFPVACYSGLSGLD